MLMVARANKRGLEQRICQPTQLVQRRCQFLMTLLRCPFSLGFDLSFDTR
jgi:hypothetical protein